MRASDISQVEKEAKRDIGDGKQMRGIGEDKIR